MRKPQRKSQILATPHNGRSLQNWEDQIEPALCAIAFTMKRFRLRCLSETDAFQQFPPPRKRDFISEVGNRNFPIYTMSTTSLLISTITTVSWCAYQAGAPAIMVGYGEFQRRARCRKGQECDAPGRSVDDGQKRFSPERFHLVRRLPRRIHLDESPGASRERPLTGSTNRARGGRSTPHSRQLSRREYRQKWRQFTASGTHARYPVHGGRQSLKPSGEFPAMKFVYFTLGSSKLSRYLVYWIPDFHKEKLPA